MAYTNWPGVRLLWDTTNNCFYGYLSDQSTLTEAKGVWSMNGTGINLYDGGFHNVLWMWSMNDSQSYPDVPSSISALRKGVLLVDGYIIGNQTSWTGRQTELSFQSGTKPTFWSWGASQKSNDSSTSINSIYQVDSVFNGQLARVVLWDRPLPSTGFTYNIGITNGFELPYGPNPAIGLISRYLGREREFQYQTSYDALTGDWLPYQPLIPAVSANVVAYYKFDEQPMSNSITSQDYAGTALPGYGAQKKPASGNTLSFFGTTILSGLYELSDTFNVNSSDDLYRTGSVTFEDENGIRRRVGTIFYELGMVVFDSEYINGSGSGLPLLLSVAGSGVTFSQGATANNLWVRGLNFTSQTDIERMVVNVSATGTEMIYTENPTGIDETTGDFVLPEQQSYITSIGLYNDFNELVAIAKLNEPVRKDADHNVNAQVFLDF